MRLFKGVVIVFFLMVLLGLMGIVGLDWVVSLSVRSQVKEEISELSNARVGVVLGTSKFLVQGGINPYYHNRIVAATELYNAEKVKYLLVSGDNGQKEYDEPQTIRKDLILAGVNPDDIFLDFAGFRTYDSMVRAKEIFNLQSFIVVSQHFHLERALFIGNWLGLEVEGYPAKDVSFQSGFKVWVREKLARVKMLLEMLWGSQPKYLGDPVEIPK